LSRPLGEAMNQHLSLVGLVVADYDEAITFFTRALNF
jgi:catechol 2,3-dioxygenase-like lactoylglutathione lyase family enzyme